MLVGLVGELAPVGGLELGLVAACALGFQAWAAVVLALELGHGPGELTADFWMACLAAIVLQFQSPTSFEGILNFILETVQIAKPTGLLHPLNKVLGVGRPHT